MTIRNIRCEYFERTFHLLTFNIPNLPPTPSPLQFDPFGVLQEHDMFQVCSISSFRIYQSKPKQDESRKTG